ncbi:hypothetical protein PMAYCL1PPCAC_19853, partial [Pristionchus mayeri]
NLAIFYKPRGISDATLAIFNCFIAVEISVLLMIVAFVSMTIRIVWRSALFHQNLRGMVTFLLTHSYIHVVCRIPLILCITQVILLDLSDGVGVLEIILIIASVLRLYHGLTVLFLFCATVVERAFATIRIRDYETTRRIHISIVLRLAVVAISLLFALDVTFGEYQFFSKLYRTCYSILQITSFEVSLYLYFYNRHRLKHVLKRPESYSLSLRYQLIENLRSFRFLQVITTAGVVGITVNCLVLMTPHYVLQDDLNARALCGASFEMLYAL